MSGFNSNTNYNFSSNSNTSPNQTIRPGFSHEPAQSVLPVQFAGQRPSSFRQFSSSRTSTSSAGSGYNRSSSNSNIPASSPSPSISSPPRNGQTMSPDDYKRQLLQQSNLDGLDSWAGAKPPPIIAKSLSSITALADNPPLRFAPPRSNNFPSSGPIRSREEEEREKALGLTSSLSRVTPALTLYFVRIPGRKNGDFIITTREPLKSTITGEDINGCLYYVFVHDLEDGQANANGNVEVGGPGFGQSQNEGGERMSNIGMIQPPRRPSFLPRKSRRWSSFGKDKLGGGEGGEAAAGHLRSRNHNGLVTRDRSREFGMTIVRRDAASGEQWNVAEVCTGVGIGKDGGIVVDDSLPSPIVIALPREGYTKFLPPAPVRRKPAVPLCDALSVLPPLPTPPVMPGNKSSRAEQEDYFMQKRQYDEQVLNHQSMVREELERQEELGRKAFEERALVREILYDPGEGHRWKSIFKRKSRHWKSSSSFSTVAVAGDGERKYEAEEEVEKGRRKKGYVFDGLWGAGTGQDYGQDHGQKESQNPNLQPTAAVNSRAGKCVFREIAGGKILKCKYYPPLSPSSGTRGQFSRQPVSGLDSLASPSSLEYNSSLEHPASSSVLLSALEFKLPSSSAYTQANQHRQGNLEGMEQSQHAQHAAGGAGGPGTGASRIEGTGRAKLATFVVHALGMDMLDLLVAANVGVFWRKWEEWDRQRGATGW